MQPVGSGGGAQNNSELLLIQCQVEAGSLQHMFEKFINKMLTFKKDNCNELVPLPEYSGIISSAKLYSAPGHTGEWGERGPGQKGTLNLPGKCLGNDVSETQLEHEAWSGAETPRGGLTNCGGSKGVYEGVCACTRVSTWAHVLQGQTIYLYPNQIEHNGLHYNFLPVFKS